MSKRKIDGHELTSQMNNLIDAVLADENVKGSAIAGGGKTTLLKAIPKYHDGKKGLYICLNKSLEEEAREKFKGTGVDVYTSHAFALNQFPKDIRDRYQTRIKKVKG